MVADRIEVTSRRAGAAEAWVWTSSGGAGFEIAPASEEQAGRVPRGTRVVLHLKDDAKKYLEPVDARAGGAHQYSDHMLVPIELVDEKGEARQINAASALWQRPKSEVKPEDYTQAYRSIAMAFDEPALTLHYKVEGRHQSYAVLLFVPSMPPVRPVRSRRKGRVKLYVRRVFITDEAEIAAGLAALRARRHRSARTCRSTSRARCCRTTQVAQIRKAVTNRILADLEKLAGDDDASASESLGGVRPVIKEGLYEDSERRDQLYKIARFRTTTEPKAWRSLADYVAALRPPTRPRSTTPSATARKATFLAGPQLEALRGAASRCCCSPIRSTRSGPRSSRASTASRSSR